MYNHASTTGSSTKNIVHSPSLVSNQIFPLSFSTIPLHIASPSPVPEVFVVKLGVNILLYIFSEYHSRYLLLKQLHTFLKVCFVFQLLFSWIQEQIELHFEEDL